MNWGLNRAAKVLGHVTDAYRPCGVSDPLNGSNRYLRLSAAFSQAEAGFHRAVGYGVAVWRGYFDAAYTRAGDYLSQDQGIWFIAAQQSLAPVLCVKTNRVITITRMFFTTTGDPYAASPAKGGDQILTNWPASVLGINSGGKSSSGLPGDTTTAAWTILLPAVHGQILRVADIVTDENGVTGTIIAVESGELGWRLNVRQVTT